MKEKANRTAYKNKHRDSHYDRLELAFPKGEKERIKTIAAEMGLSVNEYIYTLFCRDTVGGHSAMAANRGLTPEQHEQLDKWQVAAKYRDMIESMGVDERSGMDKTYTIVLKSGYINDYSGTRFLVVNKMQDIRNGVVNICAVFKPTKLSSFC